MSEPAVFAICDMYDIAPGEARGFRLLRREAGGKVRPFALVVLRTEDNRYFGYENRCPHTGVWLNVRSGKYLDEQGDALVCSRHGARFTLESGLCLTGPCEGQWLESFPVAAVAGDVCLIGVDLVEADESQYPSANWDDTLDITIHPG